MNFKVIHAVPRGKTRATYSAPTIATAKASGLRLSVETMISPPGLVNAASALTPAAGSGTCLEHLHAGHQVEGRGPFLRQFLRRDRSIIHGDLGLQSMQFRHLEHRRRQVDTEDLRAGARHRFGQNAAAAADIEHLGVCQTRSVFDILKAQGIEVVKRLGRGPSDPHQLCASAVNFARVPRGRRFERILARRVTLRISIRMAQAAARVGHSRPVQTGQLPVAKQLPAGTQTSLTMPGPPHVTNCATGSLKG